MGVYPPEAIGQNKYQRWADTIEAADWQDAEKKALSQCSELVIAGVIQIPEGSPDPQCVDTVGFSPRP